MTPQQTEFLASNHRGVLVTLKRDGRPQLSNVVYAFDGKRVRISATDDRAKTRNLRRDPRLSLHVTDESFGRYLVVEGIASVSPPVSESGDATGRELEEVYRLIAGEHEDWDEFHRVMLEERRVVIDFVPGHVYGTV